MTPNDLKILLHCHVSGAKHPRHDAPAVRDTISAYLIHGIIEPHVPDGVYRTTAKGRAGLTAILQVPYPKQAWVGKDGKIITEDEKQWTGKHS